MRLLACVSLVGAMAVVLALGRDVQPVVELASNQLDPVADVTSNEILVWRFFPRTPCEIGSDNPTCPAGDGIPGLINGFCKDQAVCNPLSAAERLPKNKKIIATHFYVGEGKLMKVRPGAQMKECTASNGDCPIGWCRWQEMTTGFGKFKNWSGDRDRTALVVADLADK